MPRFSPLPFVALALAAVPTAAQNSPSDFKLPDPSSSPSPSVQGPVDDTGIVPVGPRVIPTETPTPTPTPTPSPSATPSASPTIAAEPTILPPSGARTSATPASRQPVPSSTIAARPEERAPTPAVTAPAPDESTPTTAQEPQPDAAPVPNALPTMPGELAEDAQASQSGESFPAWYWAVGALALLLLGGGIWALLKRRAALAEPPTIEPPVVGQTDSGPVAGDKLRFDATLEIESVMRSVMMVTVKYRLTVANRSGSALRDLTISADLVSARKASGAGEQLADKATSLPQAASVERIGPHQSRSISGSVQFSTGEIEVLRQGQLPMFVPLLRLRIEGAAIETDTRTYAVGIGNGASGSRLHPLPLNGPPGSYQGVTARRITQPAN
ncbi:hypothetical protein [Altererythrobacter sp.]|uniref:hypothetical protein n=1 Tax=Altererythrobacter sp. TaxID=1872480 RepID=UPI003D13FE4B